jgi:hypothetical protein
VNSSQTSLSTDSLRLEYPGETDLVTWNAHRDTGYTTYTVGRPPAWYAYFLGGAAEMAAGEFGASYSRWNGKTVDLKATRYG